MKKISLTIAAISMMASPAFADKANDVKVFDHTKTIIQSNPVTERRCQDVEVPIYQQGGGASGADVLGGMIIGGLLGSQRNKQNSQQIVGYRQEQRCSTSYTAQTEQVLGYTQIVVDAGGYKVTANTKREVKVGDVVNVGVALTVQ